MPAVTVSRTHYQGKKLRQLAEPVPGPVTHDTRFVTEMNRYVTCLRNPRGDFRDGRARPDALPPLFEPRLLTFGSEFGMMVVGFEQIDDHRYYQGWYIRWVDDHVRTHQASAKSERV